MFVKSFSFALLGAGLFFFSSCGSNQTVETTADATAPAATTATAADTTALPATGVTYTCPMHPEVVSNKPGDCPKCGMALVKKS